MFFIKNNRRAILLASLVALLGLFNFYACKKDAAGTGVDITGKWVKTASRGAQQYTFTAGNNVEFDELAVDSVSKKILGFYGKSTGKYSVRNDSLILYNLVSYNNPNSDFVPQTQLVQAKGPKTEAYQLSLNNTKSQLSLYFTCGASANCVPSPIVFNRQ